VDVEAVWQSLVADRAATQARIAAMTVDLDAVAKASAGSNLDDEHDPEGSTVAFERELAAGMRSAARKHLADIDAALEHLADGRYSECERCGRPIAPERLQALPSTRVCIACASTR
jgi:DnaK suppressor protein